MNKLEYQYFLPSGHRRIYFFHIQKTGGTSVNVSFYSLASQDPSQIERRIFTQAAPEYVLVENGLCFSASYSREIIRKGNYFYASCHFPAHAIELPEQTFTFTCFRDPVKRVISYYNMIMKFIKMNIDHHVVHTSKDWIGKSFDEFVDLIPPVYLLSQLYMFSKNFDVSEAYERVCSLSYYFFTDEFNKGIQYLNKTLHLPLAYKHAHKTMYKTDIADETIERLKSKLEKEYDLLERLKRGS